MLLGGREEGREGGREEEKRDREYEAYVWFECVHVCACVYCLKHELTVPSSYVYM